MMSSIFPRLRRSARLLPLLGLLALAACSEKDNSTDVLATLPPIHSLLYGVMKNIDEPQLLLDGTETPHNIQLRPSDAQLLEKTDMLLVTGLKAEAYLFPILESMGKDRPIVVETLNIPGLTLLPIIEGEGHEKKRKSVPEPDMHIWMDPMNAIAITQYFMQELSTLMPKHAKQLRHNAKVQIDKLHALNKELKAMFTEYGEPRKAAYVAYHPSLQYFEKRYNIVPNPAAARTHHAGLRLSEAKGMRDLAKAGEIKCLFKEPQFSPRALETLAGEFNIPIKTIDPLGSAFPNDETLYFSMMRETAATVLGCLAYLPPGDKKKTKPKPADG